MELPCKNNGSIDLNYNCQAAVTEDGIIVGAYTSNNCSGRPETLKSVNIAEQNTKEEFSEVLADSGFASFDAFEELNNLNKIIYIPDQQMNTEAEKEQNTYQEITLCIMKKKIFLSAPKIKSFLFTVTVNTKEQNNRAGFMFAKIVQPAKNKHFAPKENTGRYMLKKESSYENKSGSD